MCFFEFTPVAWHLFGAGGGKVEVIREFGNMRIRDVLFDFVNQFVWFMGSQI